MVRRTKVENKQGNKLTSKTKQIRKQRQGRVRIWYPPSLSTWYQTSIPVYFIHNEASVGAIGAMSIVVDGKKSNAVFEQKQKVVPGLNLVRERLGHRKWHSRHRSVH